MANPNPDRKLYVYTSEAWKEKGWYKIGETTQCVGERVKQQDGTATPEPLIIVDQWDSPHHSDKEFHKSLEESGVEKTRTDANREWFVVPGGIKEIKSAYHKLAHNSARPNSFAMRKEQQECHDKCIAAFEAGYNRFLFACVMRFGKTFTAYQTMKTLECNNSLILTWKPEVCNSWREDLEQHVDFEDFNFIDLRTTPREEIDFTQKNVFFSSFQYLEAESSVDKTWILDLDVDLVMVDEEHYGSKTSISSEILSHFKTDRQIHISGTPYKSWRAGLFEEDNSYFYTYKDSQFGSDPGPRMNIYALNVAQDVAKAHRAGGYVGEDGFHIGKLFAATAGKFEYESYVEDLMMRLFDPLCLMSKSAKVESPLRMKGVNKRNLDHILIRVTNSVDTARALYAMLNRILPDYEIILASGQGDGAVTNVQEVKNKIAANKKTITITCGRFETGVTIPELGAVFLFDGRKSPESYNQMNFRASTPYKSEHWNKEDFYVFDFDPHRTLELIYVTSLMDKKPGQDMRTVLGEFFDVAPVLIQVGNKLVQVKTSEVINFYNASVSDMSARFASEWGIKDRYDAKALAALSNISPSGKKKIERIIADNPDLEKGKLRKMIGSSLTSYHDKDEFKKTRQKLQAVLGRLPIAITIFGAVDLDSLLASDSSIFQLITGVTTEQYEHFLDIKVLDRDWQKDCIQHTSNKLLGIGQGSDALWKVIELYSNTTEASPGTPKFLADEMLDKLPQEIWSDKTKTFCDPAFANGSFYFLFIDRLMEGLSEVIGNPEERLKHIVENQVFAYESNEVPRLFVSALAERQYNLKELNIKPNICYNNLLERKIDMKFDVVAMNAPYNKPVHEKGRKGGYGGRTLWDKFLVSALQEWVKPGGYVCSINPPGWRKPPTKVGENLKKIVAEDNDLQYLNINSKKDGQRVFGASTRFDSIVVRKATNNSQNSQNVHVVDECGVERTVNMFNVPWLANSIMEDIEKIVAKDGEKRAKVHFSTSIYDTRKPYMSSEKGAEFVHPVVHGIRKSGPHYYYTSDNSLAHFGVPKVILSFNEKQHQPINDFSGNLGMSQVVFGIEVESEEDGEKLVNYIMTDGFQEIIKATKWSTFQTDWRMFTYFKEGFWR